MLGIFAWVVVGLVVGAAAVTAVDKFWDRISHWLNNTAANLVERALGYEARQHMQRAVSNFSRFRDKIRHKSVIYAKQQATDSFVQRTTTIMEAPVHQIDTEVVAEIDKRKELEQAFDYKQIQ